MLLQLTIMLQELRAKCSGLFDKILQLYLTPIELQWVMPQFRASVIVNNYAPRANNYASRINNYAPRINTYAPRINNLFLELTIILLELTIMLLE